MPLGALLRVLTRSRASRAVGVELGASALQAVVLERSGERLQLVAAHEASCDASNAETLTRALTELRQRLRITSPIVLGVPSTSAILTTVRPLVVNPQRAALAVQFELQQQLPFELADAAWHYRWCAGANGQPSPAASWRSVLSARQRPPASSLPGPAATTAGAGQPRAGLARSSGVIAAAMRHSLLDERLACCRRAGLSVRAVGVNPMAALNAFNLKQAMRPGSGTPDVTVLRLLDGRMAEWIVSSPELLHVIPVTSASPETLWDEVAASWQALRAQGTEVSSPVRMIGPPEELPRAQEALAGLAVDRFDPAQVLATGAGKLEHPERAVAALGLALQGLGEAAVPLNLLASAQRDEQARKVRRVSTIASGVCLVVAFGFGVSGMMEVRAQRVSVQRALEQRERLYQTLRPEVRALIQRQQQTERRSLHLEQLFGEAPALTQLLAQMAEVLPREVWLTTLECSKGETLQGLLEGHATSFQDVTGFLEQLKAAAGMTTVRPVSTNVITDATSGREVIAFVVQIERPLQPPSQASQ